MNKKIEIQTIQQIFLISTSSLFIEVQQTLENSNYSNIKEYVQLKLNFMMFLCYNIQIF